MSSVCLTSSVGMKTTKLGTGTLTYLKELIPTLALNILYNRIPSPEFLFETHSIQDFKYKKVSPKNRRMNPLYNIDRRFRDAMNVLDKKSISDVLFIFSKIENNEVIEFYRFEVKYNDDLDDDETMVENDKLDSVKFNLLKAIHQISGFPKLKAEDIECEIQLVLKDECDDVITPQGFVLGKLKINLKADKKRFYVLERSNLFTHNLKLSTKGVIYDNAMNNAESSESVVEASSTKSDRTSVKNARNNAESSKSVVEASTTKSDRTPAKKRKLEFDESFYSINCGCNIKYKIKSIGMIKCNRCHHLEHLACIAIHGDTDKTDEDHICFFCRYEKGLDIEDPLIEKYGRDRLKSIQVAKIMRLLTEYCSDKTKSASYIYKKVDRRLIKYLDNHLKYYKALKEDSEENVVIEKRLRKRNIIRMLFNEKKPCSEDQKSSSEDDD